MLANKKEKQVLKNLWLSDECARSKCMACPGEKSLPETIHTCNCSCHVRAPYPFKAKLDKLIRPNAPRPA